MYRSTSDNCKEALDSCKGSYYLTVNSVINLSSYDNICSLCAANAGQSDYFLPFSSSFFFLPVCGITYIAIAILIFQLLGLVLAIVGLILCALGKHNFFLQSKETYILYIFSWLGRSLFLITAIGFHYDDTMKIIFFHSQNKGILVAFNFYDYEQG